MGVNSLKIAFDSMKKSGSVITQALDQYLIEQGRKRDTNRLININAPSQIGGCCRARYFARTGAETDSGTIDPRSLRIFNNGDHVHDRLQTYLEGMKMLLMREVPVFNLSYEIQGHTDGILKSFDDYLVLEVKSINSRGFSELKEPKQEHVLQGLTYVFCLEEHRIFLKKQYPKWGDFYKSQNARMKEYEKMYQHLEDGSKYTREGKIHFQLSLHSILDRILYAMKNPLTKVVFLYENKDTQDLKEFVIDTRDEKYAKSTQSVLEECIILNEDVAMKKIPPRECPNKSYNRWCSYKIECWS